MRADVAPRAGPARHNGAPWGALFATDLSRAVLLEFARRSVLVSPHDPQAFIVHARKLMAMR